MVIVFALLGERGRSGPRSPEATLLADYLLRIERFTACRAQAFRSPDQLIAAFTTARKHRPTQLLLLDRSGGMFSSEQFATRLERLRDGGVQELWTAVGPADGWGEGTLAQADLKVSLGPMTLPHRLAQVVIAEQIYRAWTILAGHPYHTGH